MTLLVFIFILSLLVLVHEFGHFIVAKKNGIQVDEFGLGIPPRIFGRKFGSTLYSLNLLPFGGFVRLQGGDFTHEESKEKDVRPNSFGNKSWKVRLSVLIAGVAMNVLLSIVLYYIFFISNGFKTFSLPVIFDYSFPFGRQEFSNTVVLGILETSNVKELGLEVGDVILSVDGVNVSDFEEIRNVLSNKDSTLKREMTVSKYGSSEIATYNFVPILNENGMPAIGVALGRSMTLHYDSFSEKALVGILHTYNMFSYSIKSLGFLIRSSVISGDYTSLSNNVAGPVGIYSIVDLIMSQSQSYMFLILIDFIALLSISLAFLNILPIPALDGGRVFFVILEVLRGGKKVDPIWESRVHNFGMTLLLALFVLITIKDLIR